MRLGIIGLPASAKEAVFDALTQSSSDADAGNKPRIGTIRVPDKRVEILSDLYKPQKTIFAQVEYLLPNPNTSGGGKGEDAILHQVRSCDALAHVIRNFTGGRYGASKCSDDFHQLDQDMILADLVTIDKRLEKLELEKTRGRKFDAVEVELLRRCHDMLDKDVPLRRNAELSADPLISGFTFLSAKPQLVLFNNDDEDEELPDVSATSAETCMVIRGRLEAELAQMMPQEAAEFLEEFDIPESALERVVRASYELLGLISFFTVGEDEVRAWTIRRGTIALDAAEEIHSDIKKGFIRAEIVSYDDLMAAGNYNEARKHGTVRLEGKTYEVADGDIINFRFSV